MRLIQGELSREDSPSTPISWVAIGRLPETVVCQLFGSVSQVMRGV